MDTLNEMLSSLLAPQSDPFPVGATRGWSGDPLASMTPEALVSHFARAMTDSTLQQAYPGSYLVSARIATDDKVRHLKGEMIRRMALPHL